jgi:hypothetical protein
MIAIIMEAAQKHYRTTRALLKGGGCFQVIAAVLA